MALYLSSVSEDTALGPLGLGLCHKRNTEAQQRCPGTLSAMIRTKKTCKSIAQIKNWDGEPQKCIPEALRFWKVTSDPTLGLCTPTHITPPLPKRLCKLLSHGVTVLNRALDTKSILHDVSSPQAREEKKTRCMMLPWGSDLAGAELRLESPSYHLQTCRLRLSFAVFAKTMGVVCVGGGGRIGTGHVATG